MNVLKINVLNNIFLIKFIINVLLNVLIIYFIFQIHKTVLKIVLYHTFKLLVDSSVILNVQKDFLEIKPKRHQNVNNVVNIVIYVIQNIL